MTLIWKRGGGGSPSRTAFFETERQFVISSLCYSTTLSWEGGHRKMASGSRWVHMSPTFG